MRLWQFDPNGPSGGQPVEVIIGSFTYQAP
jgi:hypothetical protein